MCRPTFVRLVLNRVHRTPVPRLSAERAISAAEWLDEHDENELAPAVLRLHAERTLLATRDRRMRGRFTSAHPNVPVVDVPAMASDVHDLDGLRWIGNQLVEAASATDAA